MRVVIRLVRFVLSSRDREKQQPSRVIGRLMETCFCRTVGRPFSGPLAGCSTLPLIAVISGAASRRRTPWRRYKIPSAVPEGKESCLYACARVCRRLLARARSCFMKSVRAPGPRPMSVTPRPLFASLVRVPLLAPLHKCPN